MKAPMVDEVSRGQTGFLGRADWYKMSVSVVQKIDCQPTSMIFFFHFKQVKGGFMEV